MEAEKKSIQSTLKTLKSLTSNNPKLMGTVISVSASLQTLFKLTGANDINKAKASGLSLSLAFEEPFIALYNSHPVEALGLAAALIKTINDAYLCTSKSFTRQETNLKEVWEDLVGTGVLSKFIRGRKSDRKLVGDILYPVLCPMLDGQHAEGIKGTLKGQICSLLTDSATNHKENKSLLLNNDILGASRIGKLLATAEDYPLLEALFELIHVLRPRASASALRAAYLSELFQSSIALESFGCETAEKLSRVVSEARDETISQTFAGLRFLVGTGSVRKPQGFQINELRAVGSFVDLPPDHRTAYIDRKAIFLPIVNEDIEDALLVAEVALSTIRQIRLSQPQTQKPVIQVILTLTEVPFMIKEVFNVSASSAQQPTVRFDISKADLPRLQSVIRERSLAGVVLDLVRAGTDTGLRRVATSITPIPVIHMKQGEEREKEIRSLLGNPLADDSDFDRATSTSVSGVVTSSKERAEAKSLEQDLSLLVPQYQNATDFQILYKFPTSQPTSPSNSYVREPVNDFRNTDPTEEAFDPLSAGLKPRLRKGETIADKGSYLDQISSSYARDRLERLHADASGSQIGSDNENAVAKGNDRTLELRQSRMPPMPTRDVLPKELTVPPNALRIRCPFPIIQHESPMEKGCNEVLEKIQKGILHCLQQRFHEVGRGVRFARDSLFALARADLAHLQEDNRIGQDCLSSVLDDLTAKRRSVEQGYLVIMKQDVSSSVHLQGINQVHSIHETDVSVPRFPAPFFGRGPLLRKLGFGDLK